ncbi:MAG: high-potential iron-sulfur protein [Myxococcota bacterium]
MCSIPLGRRSFTGGVVLAVTGVVVGCRPKAENGLDCNDTSSLSRPDRQTRSTLKYVESSPHGVDRNCENCRYYEVRRAGECGACTLIRGPINPLGYCQSWVEVAET